MAVRPAWKTTGTRIFSRDFSFEWNPGFAVSQKKKNVVNLHNAIKDNCLEVSTKSDKELGRKLSAFNLKLDGYTLECVFQAAKVFENGGPYTDLLYVSPREAKHDARKDTSGRLIGFMYNDIMWPLNPKTAFYDYIYIKAAMQTLTADEKDELLDYEYFTDIEFNPNRSVNCQARTVAILKTLIISNKNIDEMSFEEWIEFHKMHVIN